MKTVYLISNADMKPDHLRGGNCADWLSVHGKPGKTNMSRVERAEGWLGQTGDTSSTALGEFEDFDALCEAIERAGFPDFDRGDLEAWCENGEEPYRIGPECRDTLVIEGPAGRIELPAGPDGGYMMDGTYAVPAEGWSDFAWYGDPGGWEHYPPALESFDRRRDWSIDALAEILDAAGIEYDRLSHAEGTTSDDAWSFDSLYVRTQDYGLASEAVENAIEAAES